MDRDLLERIILIGVLSVSVLMLLISIFPFIKWLLITLGIIIPSYLLWDKKRRG
jgi:hypothetical protein